MHSIDELNKIMNPNSSAENSPPKVVRQSSIIDSSRAINNVNNANNSNNMNQQITTSPSQMNSQITSQNLPISNNQRQISNGRPLQQIRELIDECHSLKNSSSFKAKFFKGLSFTNTLSTILFGAFISYISSTSDSDSNRNTTIILGILISIQQSLSSIFRIDNRSVANKQIAIKTGKLIRELLEVNYMKDRKVIQEKLRKLYKDFDELQLSAFTNGFFKRNMSFEHPEDLNGNIESPNMLV